MLLITQVNAASDKVFFENLLQAMAKTDTYQIDFQEVREVSLVDVKLYSSGYLRYEPPATFIRALDIPHLQRLVIKDEQVHIKENGRLVHTLHRDDDPGLGALVRLIMAMFQGDVAVLAEMFEIRVEGDWQTWQITLLPTDTTLKRRISRIIWYGSDAFLNRMQIMETNGDHTLTYFTHRR